MRALVLILASLASRTNDLVSGGDLDNQAWHLEWVAAPNLVLAAALNVRCEQPTGGWFTNLCLWTSGCWPPYQRMMPYTEMLKALENPHYAPQWACQ